MARSDDLAQILGGGPLVHPAGAAQPLFGRQGKVIAWNPVTLENTIEVGGATLTNVPVLGVADADMIAQGSVVGLQIMGSSWAITGRWVIPGTVEATDAITRLSQTVKAATVTDLDHTTSVVFDDLDHPGPEVTVTVKASGRLLLYLNCDLELNASSTDNRGGTMSVDLTGANTLSASPGPRAIDSFANAHITPLPGARIIVLEGLNAGATTITAKYKSTTGADVTFANRTIVAHAL